MKKRLIAMGLLAGILAGKSLWALSSDTVNVTVTPSGSQSVVITEAEYDFGALSYGTDVSSIAATAVTVTNDGTKPEGWALQLTDTGGWTAGTTWADIGYNKFALQGLFNTTRPIVGDYADNDVILSASATNATGTGAVYSGDETAAVVSPSVGSNTRSLWFRLHMPTSGADENQKTFVVTISVF